MLSVILAFHSSYMRLGHLVFWWLLAGLISVHYTSVIYWLRSRDYNKGRSTATAGLVWLIEPLSTLQGDAVSVLCVVTWSLIYSCQSALFLALWYLEDHTYSQSQAVSLFITVLMIDMVGRLCFCTYWYLKPKFIFEFLECEEIELVVFKDNTTSSTSSYPLND